MRRVRRYRSALLLGGIALLGALLLIHLGHDEQTDRVDRAEPAEVPAPPPPPRPGPKLQGTPPPLPEPSPSPIEEPSVMEPEWTFAIRVVDARDGTALVPSRLSTSWPGLVVTPLDEGAFSVAGSLPPVGIHLQVGAPLHLPRRIELEPGATPPEEIALDPCGVLWGHVHAEMGEPVAGAKVRVATGESVTDAAGKYTLPGVPLDTPLRPHVDTPVGRPLPGPSVTATLVERTVYLRIVVAEGMVHCVRVRDEAGQPVAGASILMQSDDALPPYCQAEGETDAEGRATLRNLRAGPFRLRAHKHGYDPVIRTGIEITPSEDHGLTDVVLPPGGRHWIGGRVVDPEGRPIRGARVRLLRQKPSEKRTDAEGRFRFEGLDDMVWHMGLPSPQMLPRGERIAIRKKGWVGVDLYHAPLDREGEFVLTRTGGVRGRVLGHDGTPIPKPWVYWYPEGVNPEFPDGSPLVGAQQGLESTFEVHRSGRFESDRIMAVKGSLAIADPKRGHLIKYIPLDPRPGDTVDLGDVRLEAGIVFEGRLAVHGFPLPEDGCALFYLFDPETGEVRNRGGPLGDTVVTKGRMPAGSYALVLVYEGFVSAPVFFELLPDTEIRPEIRVWKGATLRIRLQKDLPDATCHVAYAGPHTEAHAWCRCRMSGRWPFPRSIQKGDPPNEVRVDAGGTTVLDCLAPGTWHVTLRFADDTTKSYELELAEGAERTIDGAE